MSTVQEFQEISTLGTKYAAKGDFDTKDKKERKNTQELFQMQTSQRSNRVDHSPFYRVFSELVQENSEWVQSINLDTLDQGTRKAFLVKIDTSPPCSLFEKFQCQEDTFRLT